MKNVYRADVPIGKIDQNDTRFKFRRNIGEAAIEAKAESMTEIGLLNPVKLWRQGDKYTIISGWQRILAAIKCGQDTISADVYEDITSHNALLINIADNNLRENLNNYEIACQMQALKMRHQCSAEQIACMFHCSVDRVWDLLSVFDMDEAVRDAFAYGRLSLYQAVIISRFAESERSDVLALTLNEGRTVKWLRDELARQVKRDQSAESGSGGRKSVEGQANPLERNAMPKGLFVKVTPAKIPSAAGVVGPAESKERLIFIASKLYDDLMKYYPEGVLDECWDLLPSDDARRVFFPRLFEELWEAVKRSGYVEASIAGVKQWMGLL